MRDAAGARTTRILGGAVALVSAATLATVWTLQARGYNPCELCLKERIPFMAAVPLAGLLALAGPWLPRVAVRIGFAALVVVFVGGALLGAYHAGVEWHLWAGPSECSGAAAAPPDVADFLKQLDTAVVVRCDEAALQVLGLSLAAWNVLLSGALAAVALRGLRRAA